MNRATSDDDPVRLRLRQQWLQHAQAAFDIMFDSANQNQLVTFVQREDRACSLGKELSAWLLEQHLAEDQLVCIPEGAAGPCCPKCGRPGQRAAPPEEPLPARQVTCKAGEVTLRRERWHCTTCRVAFFPSGSQAAPGNGRV
jgi:hypothetical protein